MGSEMCIRDRGGYVADCGGDETPDAKLYDSQTIQGDGGGGNGDEDDQNLACENCEGVVGCAAPTKRGRSLQLVFLGNRFSHLTIVAGRKVLLVSATMKG